MRHDPWRQLPAELFGGPIASALHTLQGWRGCRGGLRPARGTLVSIHGPPPLGGSGPPLASQYSLSHPAPPPQPKEKAISEGMMSWAGCPGQRDSYTWYLEALAGGLSLIPQREINCAYNLIWSHSNDRFVLFLTLGALKGCPILIRRPGELSHRHSKRAPLDVGLCVMWSSPLFCPHLSLTKQAFMSPLYHWSQGTLKRLSHVHGVTKLVKGSARIWTQLPLTSGSVLLPYSSPQSKPKCIPPTPSPPSSCFFIPETGAGLHVSATRFFI